MTEIDTTRFKPAYRILGTSATAVVERPSFECAQGPSAMILIPALAMLEGTINRST